MIPQNRNILAALFLQFSLAHTANSSPFFPEDYSSQRVKAQASRDQEQTPAVDPFLLSGDTTLSPCDGLSFPPTTYTAGLNLTTRTPLKATSSLIPQNDDAVAPSPKKSTPEDTHYQTIEYINSFLQEDYPLPPLLPEDFDTPSPLVLKHIEQNAPKLHERFLHDEWMKTTPLSTVRNLVILLRYYGKGDVLNLNTINDRYLDHLLFVYNQKGQGRLSKEGTLFISREVQRITKRGKTDFCALSKEEDKFLRAVLELYNKKIFAPRGQLGAIRSYLGKFRDHCTQSQKGNTNKPRKRKRGNKGYINNHGSRNPTSRYKGR